MKIKEAKDQFSTTKIYKTLDNIYDEMDGTSEYVDYLHEVTELYAEQFKTQGECNLKRFNQIITEKDLQIGSQEVEIREMKYEIASLMAERIETEKMYEFMVETVAREGWKDRRRVVKVKSV